MSRLNNKSGRSNQYQSFLHDLSDHLQSAGMDFSDQKMTTNLLGMESLNDSDFSMLEQSGQNVMSVIEQHYNDYMSSTNQKNSDGQSLGFEHLTSQQQEAATMVGLAYGDAAAYARAGYKNKPESGNGVKVISVESSGTSGTLDFQEDVGMESFDNRSLQDFIPFSVVFNIEAARQDDFSETHYPTCVVSPESGGIDISVDRITVHQPIKHELTGRTTDFNERNLIEGVSDHRVLADESTTLIPQIVENMEDNVKCFVDTNLIQPYKRRIHDQSVLTAPLATDVPVNLLGLSSSQALIGAGIMDHTDAIDTKINLEHLYVQLPDNGPVIKFDVSHLPRNGFLKTPEGGGREVALNFPTSALLIKPSTKAVDGSEPAALAELRDNNYEVRLRLTVTGSANLEYGNAEVHAGRVRVETVQTVDGDERDMTKGTPKAIVDAINGAQVIGYTLDARRTNTNRRNRGTLLNNRPETERYAIPLGQPLSVPSPLMQMRETPDLDHLITAARIRNSNNAVTRLLNYADMLRSYVTNGRVHVGNVAIEGAGRHMVVPYFEEINLDLPTEINSLTSHERARDVNAVLINLIKDTAYRMKRDSCYGAALSAISTGADEAMLVVGTDAVLQQHLMVEGDERTFGIGFQSHKVVTSYDQRMDGKIILTFTRPEMAGTPDPLSFGTHAWIPELTSSVQVSRDGAHYNEAMVQPRSLHVNNLPIMAVINVTGVEEVMTRSVSVKTSAEGGSNGEGTTVDNTDEETADASTTG